MRAALHEPNASGAAVLQLGELPRPEPAAGEVRVRLCRAGVNRADAVGRGHVGTQAPPLAAAAVPHNDGAGVIDAVGEGVSPQRLGERVWLWHAGGAGALGTAAQWIALPAGQAVALPDGVAMDAGACLGSAALAAMHAVLLDGGVTGQRVLVAGGAGVVGHYAVQFARLAGARQVVASVSSPLKAGIALDAGAHAAINYREEDVAQRLRGLTGGQGVDRIIEIDLAANAALDFAVLRRGGEIVVVGSTLAQIALPFAAAMRSLASLRFFDVHELRAGDRRRAISELLAWLERGLIRHHIAVCLPLAHIAQAHALVASGDAVGRVLLAID